MWGEPRAAKQAYDSLPISTHSPRVGRTLLLRAYAARVANFNSLAPCGANRVLRAHKSYLSAFQLTRPVWGEPDFFYAWCYKSFNFNSLAPCGANLANIGEQAIINRISTHSPRVGRTRPRVDKHPFTPISTHSPRVGRTFDLVAEAAEILNFNSLAPCGANRAKRGQPAGNAAISTHSPRVGRTQPTPLYTMGPAKFQLTRPVWGEPAQFLASLFSSTISTHSPRVGRTLWPPPASRNCHNFNSLAPCGANLCLPRSHIRSPKFQLTRPVWGEPPRPLSAH